MTRRIQRLIVAFAVAVIAGCGIPLQSNPTQLDDNGVHVLPRSSTSLAPATRPVDLCVVGAQHLVAIVENLQAPLSVARTLQALADLPSTSLPVGTRSVINDGRLLTARRTTGGVAHIDVNTDFARTPPDGQILVIAQVVCTLTSLPGIGQVRFSHDGERIFVPRADGSLTNEPVSRSDYEPLRVKS